jgi:hypothetical protein
MAFNFKPNDFHKWAHLLFYKNEKKKKKKHLSQIERYAKYGTLPNNSMRTCNGLEIRMQVVQKTNMRQPKPSITLSVKCKLNQC